MAVFLLTHDEAARLDAARLADLYVEFGEDRAERVLGDAIEEIARGLSRISRIGPFGSLTEIGELSVSLSENAARCGLIDLARVAKDVGACAAQIDIAALGATMARLNRVGDRSLAVIWGPCNVMV